MNRFLLVALLGFAAVGLAQSNLFVTNKLLEKDGHFYEARARLGHFKSEPFTDLYKAYSVAFVLPYFSDRSTDDFRNYLPSGGECMDILSRIQINNYKIDDLDEFIAFDACLGYLYESTEYHEEDSKVEASVANKLQGMIEDEFFKKTYAETKIDEIDETSKRCLGDMLFDVVRVKTQFPAKSCNNHWLDLFNKFAECQGGISVEMRENDAYLSILYSVVRERAQTCFNHEVGELNEAARHAYGKDVMHRMVNKFGFSAKSKQTNEYMWPKPVVEVLDAMQGHPKHGINLREVSNLIQGVSDNHKNFMSSLLRNMATHADKVIKPKPNYKGPDATGVARYESLINDMCLTFRSSDVSNRYDYAEAFKRMVKILSHPEIFGVTQDHFLNKVLLKSFESAPLYLATSSCNILTFTQGAIRKDLSSGKQSYNVDFKPNTNEMVRWPPAGRY